MIRTGLIFGGLILVLGVTNLQIVQKERLWSPAAQAWFPGGHTDPEVALLAVRIRHAEYWDVDDSKMVQLFKMAKAAVTGEPPRQLGEHRELTLP